VRLLTLTIKLNLLIYSALLILCVITATVIFIRAKKTPVFHSLTIFYSCLILWTILYMNELMSSDEAQMYFNVRLTLVPTMFVGALFLIFALYYAGIITPGNKIKVILLVLLPELLCVWPLFTSQYFHLVLVSKKFGGYDDVWGVLMVVSEVISFLYIIAAVVLIGRILRNRGKKRVRPLWLAVCIPLLLQILQVSFKPLTDLGIYLTLPSLALFCVVLTVYIMKYRLIEIIPEASHKLFSALNEAAFIIDNNGEIVESNEAAGMCFKGITEMKPFMDFRKVIDALAQYSDDKNNLTQIKNRVAGNDGNTYEDTLALNLPAMGSRQYIINILPTYSEGNKLIGRIVVFNDMTEYRSQTLVSERNRVSDELHDSLGNSINVIRSNLEYVLKNFSDTEEVMECLRVSYDKSTGAFVQLRRIVDELKPIDIEQEGLLRALDSLFYRLRVKGLNVDFSHNIADDSQISQSKLGDTVYLICQEAISNSIVHGRAKNITVTLHSGDSELKLYITNDGNGCEHIEPKNGLNSIKERVDSLGGELSFGSPNGGGFNIKASLPVPGISGES
jgi:signal transduction histidine kinase